MAKQRKISYEQFLAGVLIHYQEIDNQELSIMIKFFEKMTGTKIDGEVLSRILEYIDLSAEQKFTLRQKCSLNSRICVGQSSNSITLEQYLNQIAGEEILSFFRNFDKEEFSEFKKEALSPKKHQIILEKAEVLLISPDQEDKQELENHGYHNILHFQDMETADDFFKRNNYKEVNKFHIVIINSKCESKQNGLKATIYGLKAKHNVILVHLEKNPIAGNVRTMMNDYHNKRCWEITGSFTDILDRVTENAILNKIISRKSLTISPPLIEQRNTLSVPKTKMNLRILFLTTEPIISYATDICQYTGLNISFQDSKNIKDKIGDYEIIIAGGKNSDRMDYWSRYRITTLSPLPLNLLIGWSGTPIIEADEDDINRYYGSTIMLDYYLGGPLATDNLSGYKEFSKAESMCGFIRCNYNERPKINNLISQVIGVISAAVSLYNEQLKKTNQEIQNLHSKSAEQLNTEYIQIMKAEKERQRKDLEPIKQHDHMVEYARRYIGLKKAGLAPTLPQGLEIEELIEETGKETDGKSKIKIINKNNQGQIICILYVGLWKNPDKVLKNYRLLGIQIPDENGNLLETKKIALNTRIYEQGSRFVPSQEEIKRFRETQLKMLCLPKDPEQLIPEDDGLCFVKRRTHSAQ